MKQQVPSDEAQNRYEIKDPLGQTMTTPVGLNDDSPYFAPDATEIRSYYEAEGYVVIRGLIDPQVCDLANEAFEKEVKPSNNFIYRQQTSNPERHVFDQSGFMLNAIQNIQSIDPVCFPRFRKLGSDIVTSAKLQAILRTFYGEPAKMAQSMYFEGNLATWAHQDSYYLDSEKIGAMVGAWFALEDIRPGAGRFFIYPRSHVSDVVKNGGHYDIAFNHSRYKETVRRFIEERRFECRAPFMGKGDVLLWNAKTIHGSLETTQPAFSRRSFTSHYIPQSHRLLQFQSIIKPMRLKKINGMDVNHPKDQVSLKNRAILAAESRFPKPILALKKLAIKMLTR